MNKQQMFEKSHKYDWFSIIADLVAIVCYIGFFLYFFNLMEIPYSGGQYAYWEDFDAIIFDSIFGPISGGQINLSLTLLAFLLVVNVPLTVIAIKKQKTSNLYDIGDYGAFTKFVQGIVSLLSFNVVGAGVRFYNTFQLTRIVNGYGFTGAMKAIPGWFKKLFQKKVKEEDPDLNPDDPETVLLKKNIKKQNILYAIRMTLTYTLLVIVGLFIFVPFYWMIMTSLRTYYDSSEALNPSLFILPSEAQWINYKVVLQELDFGIYLQNTLYVGVLSTIGTIFTTVLAAYAFARLEFKGREAIFSTLIMTMMIPGELYIITNFLTVSRNGLGWVGMGTGQNNYFLAMIIPFMTSISYIFFLRQNFKQIPESLYKAALVDGCSDLKYLTRVMIPIAAPTIVTITILNVISSWNAFIWPRLITSTGGAEGQAFWLISVALRDVSFTIPGGDRVMYNLQIAASALVTVPLIIVFLALRKYIVNGVGRSGTKG
jgi:ABC-type glycerol-3-phosphate transport system permease component